MSSRNPINVELSGQRLGRFTVIRFQRDADDRKAWLCRCECGNEKIVRQSALLLGRTRSCGCLQKQVVAELRRQAKWSDENRFKVRRAWCGIVERCTDPACHAWHNYGGRGITLHPEWLEDFEAFYAYLGQAPTPLHTVERINNDGNYVPGNVRWATRTEQCRNKRNNRLLTFRGERRTLMEWSELLGIDRKTVSCRIDRFGWSIERALTTPPRKTYDHKRTA